MTTEDRITDFRMTTHRADGAIAITTRYYCCNWVTLVNSSGLLASVPPFGSLYAYSPAEAARNHDQMVAKVDAWALAQVATPA